MIGKVKYYSPERGYGWIARKNGGPDIFVDASDILYDGNLRAGMMVDFEEVPDPEMAYHYARAKKVRALSPILIEVSPGGNPMRPYWWE